MIRQRIKVGEDKQGGEKDLFLAILGHEHSYMLFFIGSLINGAHLPLAFKACPLIYYRCREVKMNVSSLVKSGG